MKKKLIVVVLISIAMIGVGLMLLFSDSDFTADSNEIKGRLLGNEYIFYYDNNNLIMMDLDKKVINKFDKNYKVYQGLDLNYYFFKEENEKLSIDVLENNKLKEIKNIDAKNPQFYETNSIGEKPLLISITTYDENSKSVEYLYDGFKSDEYTIGYRYNEENEKYGQIPVEFADGTKSLLNVKDKTLYPKKFELLSYIGDGNYAGESKEGSNTVFEIFNKEKVLYSDKYPTSITKWYDTDYDVKKKKGLVKHDLDDGTSEFIDNNGNVITDRKVFLEMFFEMKEGYNFWWVNNHIVNLNKKELINTDFSSNNKYEVAHKDTKVDRIMEYDHRNKNVYVYDSTAKLICKLEAGKELPSKDQIFAINMYQTGIKVTDKYKKDTFYDVTDCSKGEKDYLIDKNGNVSIYLDNYFNETYRLKYNNKEIKIKNYVKHKNGYVVQSDDLVYFVE